VAIVAKRQPQLGNNKKKSHKYTGNLDKRGDGALHVIVSCLYPGSWPTHSGRTSACGAVMRVATVPHPIGRRVLPGVPDELQDGGDDRQGQPHHQHHEDTPHVVDAQGGGLGFLLFLLVVAGARVLPPLVVEDLDAPVLLQLQDGHGNGVPVG